MSRNTTTTDLRRTLLSCVIVFLYIRTIRIYGPFEHGEHLWKGSILRCAELRERAQGQTCGCVELVEGLEYFKAGDLDAARTVFAQVIETNPESAAAHLGLGRIYFQEQDLQTALQFFQEALAREPKSSLAKVLVARVREELGEMDAAMEDYEEASEIDPSRGFAQRRISRIFAQNGDYNEAIGRVRDALEHRSRWRHVSCWPICWNAPATRPRRNRNCKGCST